jgi:uncharacterized protein (TIGR02757 family)
MSGSRPVLPSSPTWPPPIRRRGAARSTWSAPTTAAQRATSLRVNRDVFRRAAGPEALSGLMTERTPAPFGFGRRSLDEEASRSRAPGWLSGAPRRRRRRRPPGLLPLLIRSHPAATIVRACRTIAPLGASLAQLTRRYDRRFLATDPVGIVRGFRDPGDREVRLSSPPAGPMGGWRGFARAWRRCSRGSAPPRGLLRRFDPRRDAARLEGFAHRFTRGRDVALYLWLLRQAAERAGSLERFFLEGDDPADPSLASAMDAFGARLFALPAAPLGDAHRGARWMLPLPRDRSVAKRHCLLLRWLVRPDDGVDLGLWRRVAPTPGRPLDDAPAARWRGRWGGRAAARRDGPWRLEVTERLRRFSPQDPVRHDFALCRLGILGHLRAARGPAARAHVMAALAQALRKDAA